MKTLAIIAAVLLVIYYIVIPVIGFILGSIFAIALKVIGVVISLALIGAVGYGLYRLIKGPSTARS